MMLDWYLFIIKYFTLSPNQIEEYSDIINGSFSLTMTYFN